MPCARGEAGRTLALHPGVHLRPSVVVFLSLSACAGAEPGSTDTAGETGDAAPVDADGDGAPAWTGVGDAARADCDDTDPDVNPDTEVLVPTGSFLQGQDGERWAEPAREVELSTYCVDRFEVTHDAFLRFLEHQEARGSSNTDDLGLGLYSLDDAVSPDVYPSAYAYDDGVWTLDPLYAGHPVTEVWEHSGEAYCAWLGKRLPTEAEWEKAARGTDGATWPWGEAPPGCERAAFARVEPSTGIDAELCYPLTVEVDALLDNVSVYGAVGMAGNVSEWVADWFSPTAYSEAGAVDPTGPDGPVEFDDGVGRYVACVARGGNWAQGAARLRTFDRWPEPEWATSNGIGFRCARPLRDATP